MALRRASLTRPCLSPFADLRDCDRSRQPVGSASRRRFATVNEQTPWTPQLGGLLGAIQTQNRPLVRDGFLRWTAALNLDSSNFDDAVAQEVQDLPRTTVSEIIRNLDPLVHPDLDVADGHRLGIGQTQFMDLTELADEFGIRPYHREVIGAMKTLLMVRGNAAEGGLLTADLETMIRCAGTAADFKAAQNFFGEAPRLQGLSGRTSRTITEFLKARFRTEPAYYQFDLPRVILTGRELVKYPQNLSVKQIQVMDKARLGLNALLREPWNREERCLSRPRTRRLRDRRSNINSFRIHFARFRREGVTIDEELMCVTMLGFARTYQMREILIKVFKMRYDIDVSYQVLDLPEGAGGGDRRFMPIRAQDIEISGGRELEPGHALRPTERFLSAIVDAFGAMGQIALAMRLADHVSRLYQLPFTAALWSKLLSWTYVHSSKPISTFRYMLGPLQDHLRISANHVQDIIYMMSSEPFSLEPSFNDFVILAKSHISVFEIDQALDVVRTKLVPHYHSLAKQHEIAIADEVLRADAAPSSPLCNGDRRRRVEINLDSAFHRIQHIINRLMKKVGGYKPLSEDPSRQDFIPDLIAEFGDLFMDKKITYRTAQGIVSLWRPKEDNVRSTSWEQREREMLPAIPPHQLLTRRAEQLQGLVEQERLRALEQSVQKASVEEDAGDYSQAYSEPNPEGRFARPEMYDDEQIRGSADDKLRWGKNIALAASADQVETPEPPPERLSLEALDFAPLERRVVKQLTRIPRKRTRDLRFPPGEANDQQLGAWRRRVLRELRG